MVSNELLPCPFRGSSMVGHLEEATVRDRTTGAQVPDATARLGVVGCAVCGCNGPSLWETRAELAERWNRRTVPGLPKRTHDELKALLADAPPLGSPWRHYRTGATHVVLAHCIREHDQEPCVVYRPLFGDVSFCRPLAEWAEDVGDGKKRFEEVE